MKSWIVSISVICVLVGVAVVAFTETGTQFVVYESADASIQATSSSGSVVQHIQTPDQVKGIYVSSFAGGSPEFMERLTHLVDTTELNTIVLDIKDYTGHVSFQTENALINAVGSSINRIADIKDVLASLHDRGIYVIGRVSTFQDPFYAQSHPSDAVQTKAGQVWKDRHGISWIDAGSPKAWEYIATIGKESYALGFDEINFDYIRFPTDGNLDDIAYTHSQGRSKVEVLSDFFAYLDQEFRPKGIPISADLFGLVTGSTNDLGIGQALEPALAHFDYVSPMIYPSHYPVGFNGWPDPNAKPYDLIRLVLGTGIDRVNGLISAVKWQKEGATVGVSSVGTSTMVATAVAAISDVQPVSTIASTTSVFEVTPFQKIALRGIDTLSATSTVRIHSKQIRPWLQDFTLGRVKYGAPEVRAQIQATYDAGLDSWLLWNAANKYTKEALLDH